MTGEGEETSRTAAPAVAIRASLELTRRFEAIMLDWDSLSSDPPPDPSRVRRVVEEALACGLELAVISGPAWLIGLPRLVESGSAGRPESRREALRDLWRRGIAANQVLVVGDHLDSPVYDAVVRLEGGPVLFVAVMEDQISRRRRRELPIVSREPGWTFVIEGVDPLLERVHESLLTLADGRLGTRGSTIIEQAGGDPSVLFSGVYTRSGAETHLLPAPRWNEIALEGSPIGTVRRVLDLHAGLLHQQYGHGLEAVEFSSLARPATVMLRASDRTGGMRAARALTPPPRAAYEEGKADGCSWMRVTGPPGSIAAGAQDELRGAADEHTLDRFAGYEGGAQGPADQGAAIKRVQDVAKLGFDRLLDEHRRAWASRWEDADVLIEGDPELQFAVRFAMFHLSVSAADAGESAVGARGLTGEAYRGHVFWDSDVYVLPFLAAAHPRAARAMLEYRIRRLPAAVRAARAQDRDGARFPWESARSGQDVTPRQARDSRGEMLPVLTGGFEEHIVADVAWAAACYIDWTGDAAFAAGPGGELIAQAARWWASRIEADEHGRGHIRRVIGPDEYHERIDDNAYTNVMARWNLRRAAALTSGSANVVEQHRWLELADTIIDGYDPVTGIYEQFAGFHALEPLLIAEVAPQRPIAAELLLGHARIRAAQVVKQADVLMLHYLVPDEVVAGSLEPNLDFYEPRTAHGSSLSPGVHAALLARAGRLDAALEMLRLTARIDLQDIGHTAAGGLHIAALGSIWRALAFGFAGLRPVGDRLAIDPVLVPGWETFDLRVRFRGSRVRVRVHSGGVEASADPPLQAISPIGEPVELTRDPERLELRTIPPRRSS